MEEETKRTYSEVIAVLRLIEDDEKFEKLPMEFIDLLRKKADPTYMPKLSKDIPLEEQKLRKETYGMLAWIAQKYWGEDLNNVLNQEICTYSDIEPECLELKNDSLSNSLIEIKKINWFEKMRIKLKLLFNKLFNNKKYNNQVKE